VKRAALGGTDGKSALPLTGRESGNTETSDNVSECSLLVYRPIISHNIILQSLGDTMRHSMRRLLQP